MNDNQSSPENLRTLADVFLPDPRSENRGLVDLFPNDDIGLRAHHANIEKIRLATSVPESIAIKFETAKNLYLYAWFVYRFHPVAEHHALTCLELGLRLRFPALPTKYWNQANRNPTLRPLLTYAIDTAAIKNEGFRQWRETVEFRARQRYSHERQIEMMEGNLQEIELDYSQATPNDQDRDWDYLSILLKALPGLRNSYAHGSTLLHDRVLGTMELVCEILNQLYEANGTSQPTS